MSHATPAPSREGYCDERVVEPGRGSWTHPCPYKAKPGTTKCGIHAVKKIDRAPTAPTAPPSVRTRRTLHVGFEWEPGTGPTYVRYGGARLTVTYIGAETDSDDPRLPTLTSIRGQTVRKDGSFGESVTERFPSLRELAPEVGELIRATFEREARP